MRILTLLLCLGLAPACLAQPFDPVFLRGDANASGTWEYADAAMVFSYLFEGGPAPTCLKAADADDSGALDITDVWWILQLFSPDGQPLLPPWPECGTDPTNDSLTCNFYPTGNCP